MVQKIGILTMMAAAMLCWATVLPAAVEVSAPAKASPKALSETPAPAPAAAPSPAPEPTSWIDKADQWIDQTKTPTSWMKWGADLRIRDEYLSSPGLDAESKATGTKDNHTNWIRIRGRWWATFTPVKDVDLNLRIEWEGREWTHPNDVNPMWNKENVVFDTLNVKLTHVGGTPLTLTIGRQDIILGDGWLVLDGTPYDGSRTIFFDAVRATYEAKEIDTTADFIFIKNSFDSFGMVPLIHTYDTIPTKNYQMEQDETGFILWLTNRSLKNTEINGYYIFKDGHREVPMPFGGDNESIHTFGARVVGDIDDHWKYRAEGATQFGFRNGQRLQAYGFNSRLTYQFKDPMDNQLRVSFEYLSGDEPGTKGTNEGWVPLWGRWPQWSELYVYTVIFTGEQRVAEITDLERLAVGWSVKPTNKLTFAADYHLLFAPTNDKAGTAGFSNNGQFRGQLITLLATYDFTKHMKGHILSEFFFPGNFYTKPRDDIATMLRAEIYFTW
jgi:hypothetical protein